MESIDDTILAWRAEARRAGTSAIDLYKSLDRNQVKPEIAVLLEAALAGVYFAAALDAAYFDTREQPSETGRHHGQTPEAGGFPAS